MCWSVANFLFRCEGKGKASSIVFVLRFVLTSVALSGGENGRVVLLVFPYCWFA